MRARDDFLVGVKRLLAERAGFRCSNPNCRMPTIGPSTDPNKSINVGVAAHITAASPGGPRYDPALSSEERRSAENGIWLCQNHAKMIDNDPARYPTEVLREWKETAEQGLSGEIEGLAPASGGAGAGRAVSLLSNEVERLSDEVSEMVGEDLERARSAFREGRSEESLEWLRRERNNKARWNALTPQLRARVLRFEAGMELDAAGDLGRAKQLAQEARSEAPLEDDTRLRALIAYRESGPEAAIKLLQGQTDIESLNFRAGLILETTRADRAKECRVVLDFEGANIEPDADTFRLRALSYLLEKDLDRARLEIQKAVERGPRWVGVRFTSAVVDYFGSLSPATLPDALPPAWPEPVDWHLIRRDDESLARLQIAARTFDELAEATENPGERRRLESWRLACLANDPEAQGQAVEYSRQLLENVPAHFQAILWTVARRFDVNLEPSEVALKKLVDDGLAEYSHILALASIYLASERPRDAVGLLGRTRGVFDGEQMGIVWIFWRAQALALDGDPEAALELIDGTTLGGKLRRVRTVILRALAEKTGDWKELERHLEGAYEQTGDPTFLADRCGLAVQQQDWDYVSDRAERLVQEVGTDEAVSLAAVAAFNTQRYELSLQLLDDNRDLFAGGKLPEDLRQVRILCHSALGVFPKAVAEAEALANEVPTTGNLVNLAQLYHAKGDLKALAMVARRLQDAPDLSPKHLLWLSQSVRLEDSGLAASLWRGAVADHLPAALVGEAVFLGFQLRLDQEAGSLYERMAELANQGEGGVWFVSVADFIPTLEEQRTSLEEILNLYRGGTAPVHIAAERLNRPLSDLYHLLPSGNERKPAPMEQFPLLVRHGGRAPLPDFSNVLSARRLNLDVTAVLLAAHLGILPAVEEAFGPLRIPADVIPALIKMAEKTTHHQPSRLEEYDEIVELAEQNLLRIVDLEPDPERDATLVEDLGEDWLALFGRAQQEDGFLLDFLPPPKLGSVDQPAVLPQGADKHLVNHRSVLEALHLEGQLSEKEYSEAMKRLGEQGRERPSLAVLEAGAAIYCSGTTAELLSNAGLLGHACEVFRVYVDSRELEEARGAARYRERSRVQVRWLSSLRDRLGQGIDEGVYQVIPLVPQDDEPVRSGPAQLDLRCLETLLKFEAEEGDVIWADDRMVSSYPVRINVPIIGIDEVLKALVGADRMTPDDYFDRLAQLRAANARYFPVQKDEILYHLRRTRVVNQKVVETRPLRILRRYVAACLAQADSLQRPPMPEQAPNQAGEVEFVAALNHEVTSALIEMWKTEADEEKRFACAEWLMSSLYLDLAHLWTLTAASAPEQEEHYTLALGLAGLVLLALDIQLDGEGDGGTGIRRSSYLDWLQARVLQKRFDADPRVVEGVAEALKSYLANLHGQAEGEGLRPSLGLLLRLFCDSLPEPLRERLTSDANFMANLGGQSARLVMLDGLAFYPDDFCRAAREAINGRESRIVPLGQDAAITFSPVEEDLGSHALKFVHPNSGADVALRDQALMLLRESPTEREAVLRKNRHWFDCPDEEFEAAVAEIASAEDPQRRLDEIEVWRKFSTAVFYAGLPEKLLGQLSLSELRPPSAAGLVRYLRLRPDAETGGPLRDTLGSAARRLAQEEGLFTAIERFVGLPVPLPETLTEAVAALPAEERRLLFKRLLESPGSPLSKIHAVRLLTRFGDDSWTYPGIILRIVSAFVSSDDTEEFEAFSALLKWVNSDFDRWPEAQSWTSSVRLALVWAHAHRLHAAFAQAGASIDWVKVHDTFTAKARRMTTEVFERDLHYYFDIAHPRQVERKVFLLMGLAYGLEGLPSPWPLGKLVGLSLYLNPTLASDGLGSFLGGDRGEKLTELLGERNASKLTHSALEELAEAALDELANLRTESTVRTKSTAWAQLYMVLGDFSPYGKLKDRVAEAIRSTDFGALIREDVTLGLSAIRVACLQAHHLGYEAIRSHLKADVLKLAERLADQNGDEALFRELTEVRLLIESALHLAVAAAPPTNVFAELTEVLAQLTKAWRSTAMVCEGVVQRLVEELPVTQGRHFWPLLIRLRAERS